MTLIDRYLARRFLSTLVKILIAMVLLFVVIDLLTHRQDDIINYGIPLKIVVLYYLTFIPTVLFEYQVAALAILVAALMVLGKAAQDQEITAALAGGISLRRLVRMPVLLAALLAVAAFFIDDHLGVRATRVAEKITKEYFSKFVSDDRDGISWTNLDGRWSCHILKFNRAALTGERVFLHSIQADLVEEIRARRIYWDEERAAWILEDGLWCTLYPKQGWEQGVVRITQLEAPFSEAPEALFALDRRAESKSARTLAEDLHRAASMGLPVQRHWVDFHVKFARPTLCFVMIWLAIPFAIRLRRGGIAIGFGISIAIGLAHLLLFYLCTGLGHLEKLPPVIAAWSATLLFLAIGIYLFKKTPT